MFLLRKIYRAERSIDSLEENHLTVWGFLHDTCRVCISIEQSRKKTVT